MTGAGKSLELKRRGLELGFDAIGVASLEPNDHGPELDRWLADGHAATMTYLHRQANRRKMPATILPGARVAVVTLTNYRHATFPVSPHGRGPRVAQYAWSQDYHAVLARRLDELAHVVLELAPGARTRGFIDAGPVPERELAQRAGLGWIGKNMMLIDPRLGSFTFIAVLLTDADFPPDLPFDADRCGSCRRCLDACPTSAFPEPHVLDARRCISYLTIERRGPFSDEEQGLLGDWLFGCDVCQDVCPWNERFAPPTADPDFAPRAEIATPDLGGFATMGTTEFANRFGDTPFSRPGLAGMRRNAAAVAHNNQSDD